MRLYSLRRVRDERYIRKMQQVHVGLSGYSYKPWQGEGRFYPAELKQKEFLKFYSGRYDTVEMDGTWYRMPSEEAVQAWLEGSPEDFSFSFKAHRTITHVRRLKPEVQESLEFMLKRLSPILKAGKMSALLVQLPPNLKRDDERLAAFFENAMKAVDGLPVRYAIEFRHESWNAPEVETILREHSVAWVAAETDETPAQKRDTADFVYARLRKSEYSGEDLQAWAEYFLTTKKDCFVYCKHEDEGSPWVWADELNKLVRRQR